MAGFSDFLEGGIQSDFSPVAASAPPPDPSSRFDDLFAEASKETGIPVAILKAQARQESSFDPNVISNTGGHGLMQIQKRTAAEPGYGVAPLDPAKLLDPAENVMFGARYLAARAKAAGVQNWNDPSQVATALTAYNGGGDPNYVQNVFQYLKPPGGGADAPATGPVDMYGNRLAGGGGAQPSPQPQPANPTPDNFLTYANQGATRNKPLQPELVTAMGFLPQLGVTMRVTSGGQDGQGEGNRRTGSTRHDHGGAGDVQFMRNGKALSWESPDDVPVLQQIVRQARENGVTGIGAGPGYMNSTTTHIGFGKQAIWGAQGGSPYAALAEAVGNVPAATRQTVGQPLNPTITAAAERGQGPAADRPARGSVMSMAQNPAPQMRQAPMMDSTTADNAGILDVLRQQQGGGGMPQSVGGLGGLGGFNIPEGMSGPPSAQQKLYEAGHLTAPARASGSSSGGGFDPGDMLQAFGMSLLSGDRKNPLKNFGQLYATLSAASTERQKTQQEHNALSQALQMSGMPAQMANTFAVNPTAAQIALKQLETAKVRTQESGYLAGLDGQPSPSQPSPAEPAAAQSGQPGMGAPTQIISGQPPQPSREISPQPAPVQTPVAPGAPAQQQGSAPASVFTSGNKTVDALFARREGLVRDYEQMSRQIGGAPTDRAKAAVEGRLKSIEKSMGQLDKQIETYAPTGSVKEYTFAMTQRQDRGLPAVPFEQWNPEQEKKDAVTARGGQPEEATSLRKEVQGLPSYKNISQAAPIYKSMLDAVTRDDRASDVNLIYGLAKVMDPTSVVRESEMTVAQAIATLPEQVAQSVRSQLGGGGRLSKDVREGIMREAYSRVNSYSQVFDQDTSQYRGIVGRRKLDEADVIPSFGQFKPYEPPKPVPKPGPSSASVAPTAPGARSPDFREVLEQYRRPDGSAPPMPAPPAPAKAFTKADFDKLPSGARLVSPDGIVRVKP